MQFTGGIGQAEKILIALQDFQLGGTERIAVRLANKWSELGRNVTIFCGSRAGPLAEMVDTKVRIVECAPSLPRGKGSKRKLGKALVRYMEQHRSDTLFLSGNCLWPLVPEIARLPMHMRPSIVTHISTPLYRHGRSRLRQIFYNIQTRYRLRCIDAAIALSKSKIAEADLVLGRKITISLPLPVLDDAEYDDQPCAPVRENVILLAGRLVKVKGFDVAIRAFARLDSKNARLVVVGDGPEFLPLTKLATHLGVDERVDFVGYAPDIRPWLDRSKVLLMSSYYEGYGAVLVEALHAGRPVICTDCTPAVADFVSTIEGCEVVPIGDVDRMSNAMNAVLNAPSPDPNLLCDSVKAYFIGPIAQQHLALFDSIQAARVFAKV